MTSRIASPLGALSAKRPCAPRLRMGFVVLVMAWALVSSRAQAQDSSPTVPAAPSAALPSRPPPPPPFNPALDVGASQAQPANPSLFQHWWFWTAVGVAAVATAVVVVISSRGHAPPATNLGNQEFQP